VDGQSKSVNCFSQDKLYQTEILTIYKGVSRRSVTHLSGLRVAGSTAVCH